MPNLSPTSIHPPSAQFPFIPELIRSLSISMLKLKPVHHQWHSQKRVANLQHPLCAGIYISLTSEKTLFLIMLLESLISGNNVFNERKNNRWSGRTNFLLQFETLIKWTINFITSDSGELALFLYYNKAL